LRIIIDESSNSIESKKICPECKDTQTVKTTKEIVGGSGEIHKINSTKICRCVFHRHSSFDNTKGISFAREVNSDYYKEKQK